MHDVTKTPFEVHIRPMDFKETEYKDLTDMVSTPHYN